MFIARYHPASISYLSSMNLADFVSPVLRKAVEEVEKVVLDALMQIRWL